MFRRKKRKLVEQTPPAPIPQPKPKVYDACKNTDKEIWRKSEDTIDGPYSPSIHVTEDGSIGINVGGDVIVLPVEDWHHLATEKGMRDAHPLTVVAVGNGGN